MNLAESYENLTRSEKKVLSYILEHERQLPMMHIEELAKASFVSKTVIINLAQKLGFSGFRELKYYFKNQLEEKLLQIGSQVDIQKDLRNIMDKTFALCDEKQLQECAEKIFNSKNVFIMARGTSKPVAYYLEHVLFSLGIHCFFIDDYNLSELFTNLVTSEDLVIFISLSGNTKKIVESAEKVQLKRATIISITSFNTNRVANLADISLFCYTNKDDTKRNDAISRLGFFVIADFLVGYVKQQINDNIKEIKNQYD